MHHLARISDSPEQRRPVPSQPRAYGKRVCLDVMASSCLQISSALTLQQLLQHETPGLIPFLRLAHQESATATKRKQSSQFSSEQAYKQRPPHHISLSLLSSTTAPRTSSPHIFLIVCALPHGRWRIGVRSGTNSGIPPRPFLFPALSTKPRMDAYGRCTPFWCEGRSVRGVC
jgi:hypothetical protein